MKQGLGKMSQRRERSRGTSCISVCTRASGHLFYDDKFRCVLYDDDSDHVDHDIQGSANFQTSLQIANSTLMENRGNT